MQNIKAVIFDLDNTIMDRSRAFRGFAETLAATYLNPVERPEELIRRIEEWDRDGYRDRTDFFREMLDELPWAAKPELEELKAFYDTHYVGNAVPMDQAVEVLRYLRAKYRIGLITNGRTSIQHGKIDRLGIRELFECILVSEEAGLRKPDPLLFAAAVDRLGLKPEACVYVGDHPRNDIEGAGRAGLETIWIKVNQPWTPELTVRPSHTIEHLGELMRLL